MLRIKFYVFSHHFNISVLNLYKYNGKISSKKINKENGYGKT